MSVLAGVDRDLKGLRRYAPELAESGLAESARVLAAAMDNDRNSATSKSMCARALIETMDRLMELAPPREENDGLDELATRRAARLAGGTAT